MSLAPDGTIIRINRAGQQLLELKVKPLGKRLVSYVAELDRPVFTALYQDALAARSRRAGQVNLLIRGAFPKAVLVEAARSTHGSECNVVLMELTHHAEVKQSLIDTQDRLDSTLHALPDMLFETGLDGRLFQLIGPQGSVLPSTQRRLHEGEFHDGMSPEARGIFLAALREADEKGRSRGQQFQLRLDQEITWIELSIVRKERVHPDGPRFVVLARDISKRKRAEELLCQNQTLLRTLTKVTPLAMCSATAKGDCFHVNDGWRTLSGRSEEAAFGDGWLECIHPGDRERVSVLWRQAVRAGAKFEAEYRMSLPGGGVRWVHCQGIPEKSAQDEVLAYVGLIIDITERMNERDQLERMVQERTEQLLSMVMELTTTEERERQALSQELHDGLAQRLAVAKLKLSALIPGKQCLGLHCGLIREMETLVDEANEVVRSLSLQLSPPMLYEFGLMSALEWLADEMYRSYGLSVVVSGDGIPVDMNRTILNQVFRATRELLINVGKHAQADIAEVTVNCENDCLTISVMDAGVGFDPGLRVTASSKGGYGLFSVRQRMGYIGGDVQIDSRLGDGSLIVLSVPLEPPL